MIRIIIKLKTLQARLIKVELSKHLIQSVVVKKEIVILVLKLTRKIRMIKMMMMMIILKEQMILMKIQIQIIGMIGQTKK